MVKFISPPRVTTARPPVSPGLTRIVRGLRKLCGTSSIILPCLVASGLVALLALFLSFLVYGIFFAFQLWLVPVLF